MQLNLKLGIRTKLLLIILSALMFGLITVGAVLYFQFRSFIVSQTKETLEHFTELTFQSLNIQELIHRNTAYLKSFVDESSERSGCRVTIIDVNGNVLADSEVSIDQLTRVENHLRRPEVQESLKKPFGFQIRHSATIGADLYYISKMLSSNNRPVGFLRLALFASTPNQMLFRAKLFFLGGGILILLISGILVFLLSRQMNKNIDILTEESEKIVGGELETLSLKLPSRSGDELEILGKNLYEMASRLSENVKKLSRERRDLSTVLSSVNDGILAIAPNKKIIFYNHRALQLLDSPSRDITNIYFYDVIRNQHLNSLVRTFLEKPFFISDEIEMENHRTLSVVLTPFEGDKHEKKGVVTVLRDISHYKKLEKIRRDFVANVSHEFKTPIAAIRGYAETLLDWALGDETVNRKYVKKIVKQSHQLESLVLDLLQLARVERLQNIEMQSFDPLPILKDIINEYREKARHKNQSINQKLKLKQMKILGEPEMFRSMIVNLVDNAMKYTPEGGKILIEAIPNGDDCTFSVHDTGMGIPFNEQTRIFERFYRVDKGRSQSIEGTGLGLSIVKHMAELQKVEIWLKSEVNVGSCFSMKFKQSKA